MRLSNRKVGGLRFIRIGRLSLSFSISKPLPAEPFGPAIPMILGGMLGLGIALGLAVTFSLGV
jgi:hypothetical protein